MKTVSVLENGTKVGTATVFEAATPSTGSADHPTLLSWHADIFLDGGETIPGVSISVCPREIDYIVRKTTGEYAAIAR